MAGRERELSDDACLRALLARQQLLERATLTPARALERVCGLQTQHAPSGYLGLHARVEGFERATLTEALTRGRVVQTWAMRREITARLGADGLRADAFPPLQHWVDLVRAPPAGTWPTPRAHVYGLAPERPAVDLDRRGSSSSAATCARSARPRLRTWPGSPGSPSPPPGTRSPGWSCAGSATNAASRCSTFPRPRSRPPTLRCRCGSWARSTPCCCSGTPPGRGSCPHRSRDRVFATSMPRSTPTFLVDGRVAGIWTHRDGRIGWTPFAELTARDRSAVDEEAERLRAWYATG